ncbi:hypothetical protein ACP4OV_021933 [Aristida adscensionis]
MDTNSVAPVRSAAPIRSTGPARRRWRRPATPAMSSDDEHRVPIASRRTHGCSPPSRRRWSRSPSPRPYRDVVQRDGRRSRSRSRGRARPRSCRSRSRTRSEECEDRTCCRPRRAGCNGDGDGDAYDDRWDTSADDDDWLTVRIYRQDDLFSCAQCDSLLSSPVFEHVTCGTCHDEGKGAGADGEDVCNRCGATEYGRSLAAAAAFLRCIRFSCVRFSCGNHAYGCPAAVPRHEMAAHERGCRYAPCFCPVRRCDFAGGPPDALERHLTARHGWAAVAVRYGEPFRVRVHTAPQSVLRAAEDGALFHLCAEWESRGGGGTSLSMIHIRPDNAATAAAAPEAGPFTYEVKAPAPAPVAGVQHRLQMQATVWGTSLKNGRADANPVRVTVPDDMFPQVGPDMDAVEVVLRKVAPNTVVAANGVGVGNS